MRVIHNISEVHIHKIIIIYNSVLLASRIRVYYTIVVRIIYKYIGIDIKVYARVLQEHNIYMRYL